MGRQYYCEFCEKSFADNPSSRKNHLNGSIHKINRQNHYNSYKGAQYKPSDPEQKLQEERSKRPCKNYPRGICNFSENCRFSHLSEYDFAQLEQQVLQKRIIKANRLQTGSLEDWLAKREKRLKEAKQTSEEPDLSLPVYSMPPTLMQIPNIPPSVLPPPPDCFVDLKLVEWG